MTPFPPGNPPGRRAGRLSPVLLSLGVGLVGCGSDAEIRPGDIRRYVVPRAVAGTAAARSPNARPPTAPPPGSARAGVRFDLPPGWSERGGAAGMRLATIAIGPESAGDEVTVIAASGSLRGNVERWQRQLTETAADREIARAVDEALAEGDTVDVAGRTATVVLLDDAPGAEPGQQAILAAMIPLAAPDADPAGGQPALFVKFKGAADVARRERTRFREFVGSIRLDQPPAN